MIDVSVIELQIDLCLNIAYTLRLCVIIRIFCLVLNAINEICDFFYIAHDNRSIGTSKRILTDSFCRPDVTLTRKRL